MTLETTQLLSTAIHLRDDWVFDGRLYKPTHKNHPCSVWARESGGNFHWLCKHGLALAQEYQKRYSKSHACESMLIDFIDFSYSKGLNSEETTPFAQCMPDEYKRDDPVEAYKLYYSLDKLPKLG